MQAAFFSKEALIVKNKTTLSFKYKIIFIKKKKNPNIGGLFDIYFKDVYLSSLSMQERF